jgi:hypothetical protein
MTDAIGLLAAMGLIAALLIAYGWLRIAARCVAGLLRGFGESLSASDGCTFTANRAVLNSTATGDCQCKAIGCSVVPVSGFSSPGGQRVIIELEANR